jgi:hypothetical protein
MRIAGSVLCLLVLAVLFVPGQVAASHYPLEVVPFIEEEHKAKFDELKLLDTEELLDALRSPADRKALARKSGIKKDILTGYVQTCDLLRVRGVGPKMAKLLKLSGVTSIKVFRGEKPAELRLRLVEVNKKHGVSEILPQEETLKDWIHQARKLKIIVK